MQQEEHMRTDEPNQMPPDTEGPASQSAPDTPPASSEEKEFGSAGIVGIIILILAIALGGLYFWSMNAEAPYIEESAPIEEPKTDPVLESMTQLDSSTELSAIDQDVENTDVDSIDSGFDEFQAAFEAEAQ